MLSLLFISSGTHAPTISVKSWKEIGVSNMGHDSFISKKRREMGAAMAPRKEFMAHSLE